METSVQDRIAEAIKAMPEVQARQVLDFVLALQQQKDERRAEALAVLQRHRGRFNVDAVAPLDRAELHERTPLR